MNQLKNYTVEWIDEKPKVSNLAQMKEAKPTVGKLLIQTEFIDKIKKQKKIENEAIQTIKDIVITKKNVTGIMAAKMVSVPKAINENNLPTKAEQLPVYVEKKWIGNKD